MISSLTHFIAVKKGFYAQQGLEVEAVEIPSSNVIASELIEGKIDVAIELSFVPLIKSINSSSPPRFKIFSMSRITKAQSFDGIVVKASSPLRQFKDLSGKMVGVFPGTTAGNTFLAEFAKAAPGVPAPRYTTIDPKLQLSAFEKDSIDALYAYEPTLSLAKTKYNARVLPGTGLYGRQLEPNPIGVAAINTDFQSTRTDDCNRIIRALDLAAEFIEKHPKESRQILAETTGLPAAACTEMSDLRMSKSDAVQLKILRQLETEFVRIGELKKAGLTPEHLYVTQKSGTGQ